MIKPTVLALILSQNLEIATLTNNNYYFPITDNFIAEQVKNKSTLEYNYITTEDYLKEKAQQSLDFMIINGLTE